MDEPLVFFYTNYKGEASKRTVIKPQIVYRDSAWHGKENEPVWMIEAWDCDKNETREFLMSDILRIE